MKAGQRVLVVVVLAALAGCKDKASDKPADKPVDKPAEAATDKPVDKPAEAAADTPAEAAAAKPAEPAAATPAAADGWTTYTSKEGKYTIEFPTPPTERGMLVTSEFGTTDADSRTSACGIAVTPVPGGKDASPKVMLEAMASGYKTDAKVLEEKDITMGTHPGKSLVIENASHRKWFRLYVINDKLVINNCGGPFDRGDKDAVVAKRVLDSFKPQL